ncbi:hypothetical protein D3C74_90260 [compost metagenome]
MVLQNKKHVNANSLHYNRLEHEISSYQERLVHDDGSVSFHKVENPYFKNENTWSIDIIGSIANFQDQRNKYNRSNRNIRFEFHNPFVNLVELRVKAAMLKITDCCLSYGSRHTLNAT